MIFKLKVSKKKKKCFNKQPLKSFPLYEFKKKNYYDNIIFTFHSNSIQLIIIT